MSEKMITDICAAAIGIVFILCYFKPWRKHEEIMNLLNEKLEWALK